LLTTDIAADNELLRSIKLNAAAQSVTQKHTHPKGFLKKIFDPHRSDPNPVDFSKEFLILGFF
jgi:hypothetical protein